MKRKFLIWSAVLTVVFGAALLQSCSADDDTFATEEFGYYTEEEITDMKAIAEKYNMTISVDENYSGKKASLEEFEETIIQLRNFPGDYQLVKSEDNEKYCLMKNSADITGLNRSMTRAAELTMNGEVMVGTIYPNHSSYSCTIYLSWTLPSGPYKGSVSLSVNPPYQLEGNNNSMINASITSSSISINENISIIRYGTNYGRYNVSGVHRASGNSEFKITKVS